MDRGRLVRQAELATLRVPTGRVVLHSPDADRIVALLDGRVEARDGDRLAIRHADPAALNTELVAAGLRVAELAPERQTLEDVVLAATGTGSDRIDR
jgi:ABC-2 type transport system ATP-binding protein